MPTRIIDLESVDPSVVDMTIHHGYPDIRVRMPITRSLILQEWLYLELRYRLDGDGKITVAYTPSPQLFENLVDEGQNLAKSPPTLPDRYKFEPGFGNPGDFSVAARKLAEFHEHGRYAEQFARYGK